MVTGDNRFAKLVSVGKLTPIKMTVKILVLKDGACLLNADTVYRMEDKTFEIITAGNLRFVIEDGIETVCFGIEWLNKKGLKYLTESFNIGGVEINILDTDSHIIGKIDDANQGISYVFYIPPGGDYELNPVNLHK